MATASWLQMTESRSNSHPVGDLVQNLTCDPGASGRMHPAGVGCSNGVDEPAVRRKPSKEVWRSTRDCERNLVRPALNMRFACPKRGRHATKPSVCSPDWLCMMLAGPCPVKDTIIWATLARLASCIWRVIGICYAMMPGGWWPPCGCISLRVSSLTYTNRPGAHSIWHRTWRGCCLLKSALCHVLRKLHKRFRESVDPAW